MRKCLPVLLSTFLAITIVAAPVPKDVFPKPGFEKEIEIARGVKMRFCWIPAGEVQLGSTKADQDDVTAQFGGQAPDWLKTETEDYRGKFKTNGFWLGKCTVTQAEYEAVMKVNPSQFKGERLPVESVSWNDTQEFIKKCTLKGLRLPHEDEWEYACRGGQVDKQPFYWGKALNGEKANCNGGTPFGTEAKGPYLGRTRAVGSFEKFAPHPWGLCDMHGNVNQFCNNTLSKDSTQHVYRGGGWSNLARGCRMTRRFDLLDDDEKSDYVGFRLLIPSP